MSGTYQTWPPPPSSGGGGGSGTVTQVNTGAGLTGGPITTTGTIQVASVSLVSQVVGNLPVTNLNSGASANASTFWRGDGAWATPAGSSGSALGTVTQVNTGPGLFGGPITTNGTLSVASISLNSQVLGVLPVSFIALIPLNQSANQTTGSITLGLQTTGSLPLSQTSGSISLTAQVSGVLPLANTSAIPIQSGSGKTTGSLSLGLQTTGSLPLSQTSGSISLINQIVGVLPQGNLTLTPTFTTATLGSVSVTSSSGGAALSFTFPGSYGNSGQALSVSSAGFLSWQTPAAGGAATTGSVTQTSSTGGSAYTVSWPGTQGSTNSVLSNNGAGGLGWYTYKAPTAQKFTSSSGGGALTYTTPISPSPVYLRVRLVGGGGGGGPSGTTAGSSAGAGGQTFFTISSGISMLFGNGGGGAGLDSNPTVGGTASLGSITIGFAVQGGGGNGCSTIINSAGGMGGVSPFGGAGAGATAQGAGGAAGSAAIANSGSGGGGASAGSTASSIDGVGGGAGGYVDAVIPSPAATYTYQVGAGGGGGGAGTNGSAGGAGGSGFIVVEEFYQ